MQPTGNFALAIALVGVLWLVLVVEKLRGTLFAKRVAPRRRWFYRGLRAYRPIRVELVDGRPFWMDRDGAVYEGEGTRRRVQNEAIVREVHDRVKSIRLGKR